MTDKSPRRVAIVAGVGPGLGASLVKKLAQEGCRVGMFARSPAFIGKLAAELGPELLAVPTDISDAKQVAAGFRKVRDKLGPVEILIAHASGSLGGHLEKISPEEFERSWRTAVFGAFLCAREALPDMLKRRGGIQQRKVRCARPGPIPRSRAVAKRHSRGACHHRWRDRHTEGAQNLQAFCERSPAPARCYCRCLLASHPTRPKRMELGNRSTSQYRGVL